MVERPHLDQHARDLLDDGLVLDAEPAHDDEEAE